MNVKLFVLGRPGSGKSTAASYIKRLFALRGYTTHHINDYTILQAMFHADVEHKQFRPTANNGFDAIDLSVMDTALHEVERNAEEWLPFTNLVTIEFARDNYHHALRQFHPDFLRDAHILFMDADIETCLRRVHQRVEHAASTDDHPSFSDDIFRRYYGPDNRAYMSYYVQQAFKMRKLVQVIDNRCSLEECIQQVDQFAHAVFEYEMSFSISPPALAG